LYLSLIIYGLSESIAIYGLVLFVMAGNSLNFYIFLILCLVCLGIYFPRYSQWESWAKREWNLKNKGGRETSNAMPNKFRCKECNALIVEKSLKWDNRQVCPYCGAEDAMA
jgi:hypothetical protein